MYYLPTNFDLSDAARKFTLDQYQGRFIENFYHGEDTLECSPQRQFMWKNSIVGREINEFLQSYGCDIYWDDILFFISNLPLLIPVSSKFNLLKKFNSICN
jgi:hypothetical protein